MSHALQILVVEIVGLLGKNHYKQNKDEKTQSSHVDMPVVWISPQ